MYNNIIHDQSTNDTEEGVLLHPRAPRLANLSSKVEEFARMKATQHFLTEGKLLSPHSSCFKTPAGRSILTDEEYIGGCCIGLCHDLSKHAVNRASNAANDSMAVPFIESCRDTAVVILDALLAFDFRNGPLRRKYDSLKYALKNLETVLYELSVAGAVGGNKLDGPAKKKAKTEGRGTGEASADSPSLLPKDDIEKIRERMEHRDKLRETLIKTCRDGQKQAKQAIFALHRNDMKTASTLLSKCEECVEQNLVPILREEPCLRSGSFTVRTHLSLLESRYAYTNHFTLLLRLRVCSKNTSRPSYLPHGLSRARRRKVEEFYFLKRYRYQYQTRNSWGD